MLEMEADLPLSNAQLYAEMKKEMRGAGGYVHVYSFSHNHGSGKWLYLKGIYYWRYTHFSLNHDYGRKGIFFCFSPMSVPLGCMVWVEKR